MDVALPARADKGSELPLIPHAHVLLVQQPGRRDSWLTGATWRPVDVVDNGMDPLDQLLACGRHVALQQLHVQ
eukprot:5482889-Lingulodinium_polyedra.AAC.1